MTHSLKMTCIIHTRPFATYFIGMCQFLLKQCIFALFPVTKVEHWLNLLMLVRSSTVMCFLLCFPTVATLVLQNPASLPEASLKNIPFHQHSKSLMMSSHPWCWNHELLLAFSIA